MRTCAPSTGGYAMLATLRFFIESFLSTAFDACDITLRERVRKLCALCICGSYRFNGMRNLSIQTPLVNCWFACSSFRSYKNIYISTQFDIQHCMATHTCIKTIFHRADMCYFVSVHNFIAPVPCFVAIFRKRIVSWVVDNNAKSLSVYKTVCVIPQHNIQFGRRKFLFAIWTGTHL